MDGVRRMKPGRLGGGRGASTKMASLSKARPWVRAIAVSMERWRVEENTSPASATKLTRACGGIWPGRMPSTSYLAQNCR